MHTLVSEFLSIFYDPTVGDIAHSFQQHPAEVLSIPQDSQKQEAADGPRYGCGLACARVAGSQFP